MKQIIVFIGCCFALVQSVPAQTIPPEVTDPEEREILAIAVKLTRPSLAYRTVAVEKLLREANIVSEQLKLPTPHPIQPSDANIRVRPPWFSKSDSTNMSLSKADRIRAATFFASGVVESANFAYSLGGPENCRYVHRFKIKDEDSIFDLYPELAKTPALIDTNGAYQLATQWLSAISVDVPALERKYKLNYYQWFFWGRPEDLTADHWTYHAPTTTNRTMLPIFDVNWGDAGSPAVKVTILGTTKELMELRMEDSSFVRRPPLIITNAMELNTRPDPPVKHLERPIQEPQTNSAGLTNPTSPRPAPFRQKVKNR
jgi:hypothetical protein